MKLCFYYYYKHQADTEIPTPGKYGDMGTEDVPLRSAKRDKGFVYSFSIINPGEMQYFLP